MFKYIISLVGIFSFVMAHAQTDTMYFFKNGKIIHKQAIGAEALDSIIFYNPTLANTDTVKITCFPPSVDQSELEPANPKPIVQGKILSWAVSSDDEIAYTPPGKWVNVFGTVYYRYIERAEGSNIKVAEVAASASSILTSDQLDLIVDIIESQTLGENRGIANRNAIARELIKWRNGEDGDEELILNLARENGTIINTLIQQKASVYGTILKSLSNTQKNALCELRASADHANSPKDALSELDKQLTKEQRNILRLLLSKFFIWATGVEKMNEVVDAGRPAVFFGFANLRVEDRSGTDVSKGLRGEASKLIENTLNADQSSVLDTLISEQSASLDEFYSTRAALAVEIMKYQKPNSIVDTVALSQIALRSEMVEAELAIIQAKAMGTIIQSFSEEQMTTLVDFKNGNGD